MNLARKLFKIAFGKREETMEPHIKFIKKEAKKAAEESLYCVKIEMEAKARFFKEDISKHMYEEGFTVETEYYRRLGRFIITLDWERENPKNPRHVEY